MKKIDVEKYKVTSGTDFRLSDYSTKPDRKIDDDDSKDIVERNLKSISDFQERMYANQNRSVLIIFQAMDAAGKDGTIERLVTGVNPQGVLVRAFKAPSSLELRHDFLWRVQLKLPPRGIIGIFNRSHYEEVLVVRVHPEYLVPQNIPGIESAADVTESFWHRRFEMIRNFERNQVDAGTTVLKFFLHISKKEQKDRLMDRIEKPEKNWKFNIGDVTERPYWDEYMHAFEEAIINTATPDSPWFVIPGDNKDTARALVTTIVAKELEKVKEPWPKSDVKKQAEVKKGKDLLDNEE